MIFAFTRGNLSPSARGGRCPVTPPPPLMVTPTATPARGSWAVNATNLTDTPAFMPAWRTGAGGGLKCSRRWSGARVVNLENGIREPAPVRARKRQQVGLWPTALVIGAVSVCVNIGAIDGVRRYCV